jgi:hypothetical protein
METHSQAMRHHRHLAGRRLLKLSGDESDKFSSGLVRGVDMPISPELGFSTFTAVELRSTFSTFEKFRMSQRLTAWSPCSVLSPALGPSPVAMPRGLNGRPHVPLVAAAQILRLGCVDIFRVLDSTRER